MPSTILRLRAGEGSRFRTGSRGTDTQVPWVAGCVSVMGLHVLHRLDRRNPLSEALDRGFSRSCQRGKAVVRAVAEAIDRTQEGSAYSYVMGGIGGARRIAVVRLLDVGCSGRLVTVGRGAATLRPWRLRAGF